MFLLHYLLIRQASGPEGLEIVDCNIMKSIGLRDLSLSPKKKRKKKRGKKQAAEALKQV